MLLLNEIKVYFCSPKIFNHLTIKNNNYDKS